MNFVSKCWKLCGYLILFNLFACLASTNSAFYVTSEDFTGQKLLQITPENKEQLEILQKLHTHPPANIKHLDFWNEPSRLHENVLVRVGQHQMEQLERMLRQWSIRFTVAVHNLQSIIDDHAKANQETRTDAEVSIYDSYLTYDEIVAWLEDVVYRCNDRCALINIGSSFEGRPLPVLKVSSDKMKKNEGDTEKTDKPSVWVDAGIHAREWISHSTAMYFIDRLVSDYELDSDVQSMLDQYDWYIMPCVNPDGYQYSHDKNRLWRKTRSKSKQSSECFGVDANRNFGFHWGTVGVSGDPCSDVYPGLGPFSERETAALSDFILSRNGTWNTFLTLHSYGQLWMASYGYTRQKPINYPALMKAAHSATRAIEDVYGTVYEVGSASEVLYESSGTSRDWATGVAKIPYVFTIELRDRGYYGFLLPPDQILSVGIETWEGIKAYFRNIQSQ